MGQDGGMSNATRVKVAYGALVVYQMVMAVWAVVGSQALAQLDDVPLAAFLSGRHFLASVCLGLLCLRKHGAKALFPQDGDLQRIVLAGVLAQYGSPMFYLYGMQFVPPTIGSIFDGPLIPLMVYVMAVCVGVELLPRTVMGRVMVAVALGLSSGGAALVIVASSSEPEPAETPAGNAAMFVPAVVSLALESICLSASLILAKPMAKKYPLLPFSCWMAMSGLAAVLVQVAVYEDGGFVGTVRILATACSSSTPYASALLYNVVGIAMVNTMCSSFANATLPSSVVALGACVQPVFTLLLDVYLNGAPLTFLHVVALAAVAAGIYLFTKHGAGPEVSPESSTKKLDVDSPEEA